ncbi:MAG TPA: carbohydrate binding domain-containing protein [Candidatus Limnocylindrales bacterium]|nr:carbohydrate binding domain-containing protein [Candidatus Limnocylindrales bacterium]
MKQLLLVLCFLSTSLRAAERYADRFVWIFGWGLDKDSDVAEISKILQTAGQHHLNGAVMSFGFDTLCKQPSDYFRRLDEIKKACDDNRLELIPSLFSVGYGGGALAHDRNLAEGLSVVDAPFVVKGAEARFVTGGSAGLLNGGFEEFAGNNFKAFNFHDQPGEISFADTEVKHGGKASIRLENFTANQHGHGRVMQSVKVQPHRCYRVTLWVKTAGLQPANAFRVLALAGDRELAPREFHVPGTTDWRKITMVFNSLNFDQVSLYAGLWGGKSGKVWLDDWSIEEIGPVNVLHRPGTPVAVRSEDGATTYVEGKDYATLMDANLQPWHDDKEALPLKLLPGGRIHDGDRLRVSWYHSMIINDSQVGVCMAEPGLYEIYDHEAKLLAEKVQPRSVLLNMDEIRMGGTCKACRGRNMGELLGQCVSKQAAILRTHIPSLEVYIWSDMLDPNHNAHGNYYLVDGDYTGSWQHVPKNLIMTVWGGEPREKSLRFFADQGFRTLVACYYDADNLKEVQGWLDVAAPFRKVRGFMYTPWEKKYELLPDFGDLLHSQPARPRTPAPETK